jgi:N-acyl-D-aspartate/D-glutamate deacylase
VKTYLRGVLVAEDGEVVGQAGGRYLG